MEFLGQIGLYRRFGGYGEITACGQNRATMVSYRKVKVER